MDEKDRERSRRNLILGVVHALLAIGILLAFVLVQGGG